MRKSMAAVLWPMAKTRIVNLIAKSRLFVFALPLFRMGLSRKAWSKALLSAINKVGRWKGKLINSIKLGVHAPAMWLCCFAFWSHKLIDLRQPIQYFWKSEYHQFFVWWVTVRHYKRSVGRRAENGCEKYTGPSVALISEKLYSGERVEPTFIERVSMSTSCGDWSFSFG